ncbi:MAG: hypothetical protein KKA64_00980 [Nanoarchaeota archaeon]|nr:hypothetical protein [Nanoarchaeota archaeon]
MKIKKVELFHLEIPFNMSFGHSKAKRDKTDNFICKTTLKDETVGWGEGIPREYVTGETHDLFISGFNFYLNSLGNVSPESLEELVNVLKQQEVIGDSKFVGTSSKCCLELSLLDAYGKYFNKSISEIGKYLGFSDNNEINTTYSSVIGSGNIRGAIERIEMGRIVKIKDFKIKLGQKNDIRKLKKIYKKFEQEIASKEMRIRGDVNSGWDLEQAQKIMPLLAEYGLCYIEDPLKDNCQQDYKELTQNSAVPIMFDEPLRTVTEAEKFIKYNMCNGFDIRISKNGGLIDSLKIARLAKDNGIDCQVGCMVGETGILSAAGRHLIYCVEPIFAEGSYGNILLENDIIKEELTLTIGGKIGKLTESGLGITIKERQFNKYSNKVLERGIS